MSIETKIDAVASAFEEFKKLNDKRIKEIEVKDIWQISGEKLNLTLPSHEK